MIKHIPFVFVLSLVIILSGCTQKSGTETLRSSAGMELVRVPAGYWAGVYPVTQDEFAAVMGFNPSVWDGGRRPVENVDWDTAVEFCEKLTDMDAIAGVIPEGWIYTLPSEEQWEYYAADARLEDMVRGRWDGTTPLGTMPAGSLGPNKYGLYDVRGNVWEWCADWWDQKRNEKVIRGGAWDLVAAEDLKISYRPVSAAVAGDGNVGFRVVLVEKN